MPRGACQAENAGAGGSGFSQRDSGSIPAAKAFVVRWAQTTSQVVLLGYRSVLGAPSIAVSKLTIDKVIGGLYKVSIGETVLFPPNDLRS